MPRARRPLVEPDPDDDRAVEQTMAAVVARYRAAEAPGRDLGWLVEQVLQLKAVHIGAGLFDWGLGEIHTLLLEVFPAKVVLERSDLPDVPRALEALLRLLDSEGVLHHPTSSLADLVAFTHSLQGPFVAAMNDESLWGMGKRFLGGWGGTELDQASLDARMESFNALPFEMRDQLLGPLPTSARGGPLRDGTPLPPVVLAPVAELAEAAASSVWYQRVAALLAFVGNGRPVTARGNLRLADGRALVELLGTSDVMDEVFGDRVFRTVSTRELPEVDLTLELALASGLLEVEGTRLRPTADGRRPCLLVGDVVDRWTELLLALVGPVGPTRHAWRRTDEDLPWFVEGVDDDLLTLLFELYAMPSGADLDAAAAAAWTATAAEVVLQPGDEERFAHLTENTMVRAVKRVAETGAVRLSRPADEISEELRTGHGLRRSPADATVTLTPLGLHGLQSIASRIGVEAPTAGGLVEASVPALLDAVADMPPVVGDSEVDHWLDVHGPQALVDGLVGVSDVGPAFRALLRVGVEAAPAVLSVDPTSDLGPYALLWLLDVGLAKPGDVRTDEPEALVDLLTAVLDVWGSDAVPSWGRTLAGDRLEALVASVWRLDVLAVEAVLAALAASADKPLAKAARKALFQRQSRPS